ncbi:hypothetical protein K431DRAFT_312109 [Polychaeton citri CBS 116435]|uniref:BRCT domain-containing protein n=1 Tax=Polychaeton citri CBS 116435 TaxID=1314669 RepID=A0A9P4Q8T9_9PEZI|nr:hypothetical protein K431DRAFT_312109 [Polychaeton citri CBS 116435]
MPNYFKDLEIVTLQPSQDYKSDWSLDKLKGWIKHAAGKHQQKLTDKATHLVVSREAWEKRLDIVQRALQTNQYNQEDGRSQRIKIVSWDWLDDSLVKKVRRPEGPYDFEKMERRQQHESWNTEKAAGRQQNLVDGPNNVAGLMREVFRKETERPFTEQERMTMEEEDKASMRERLRIQKEQKTEVELLRRQFREEHHSVFLKGVKRARDELMTENYHIYQDSTGFKYEVALTKVLAQQNRNERIILTIYESNSLPHTYAMNTLRAGTGKTPETNTVVAVGSTYELAFLCFRKIFSDFIGIEWDDRIEIGLARTKRERAERNSKAFTQPASARIARRKGQSNDDKVAKEAEDRWVQQRLAFNKAKFEYYPPAYGPVGWLEPGQEQNVEILQAMLTGRRPRPLVRDQNQVDWQRRFSRELQEAGLGLADGANSFVSGPEPGLNPTNYVQTPAPICNRASDSHFGLGGFVGESTPFCLNNRAPSRAATVFDFDEFNSNGVTERYNTPDSTARLTPNLVFSRATTATPDDDVAASAYTMAGAIQVAESRATTPNHAGRYEVVEDSTTPDHLEQVGMRQKLQAHSTADPRLRGRSIGNESATVDIVHASPSLQASMSESALGKRKRVSCSEGEDEDVVNGVGNPTGSIEPPEVE